jgi:hypothetical protein
MKLTAAFFVLLPFCVPAHAQSIDDGVMIPRHTLFSGNLFTYDSWDHYWEGHLSRVNGNLGTVTTETNTWFGDYGVINHLDFIMQVPYVWTDASKGVLHDMKGFQNITLAGKYAFLSRPFTQKGDLTAIGVVSGSIPMTNYEPAFQPLSIGNQSKTISTRLTLNFQAHKGWYGNASSSYTWRSNVSLDQPYYYTNGQFYDTNQVVMPQVFDYTGQAGYHKNDLMAFFYWSQQRTQGGGDIRRQDMPFISNHINYEKIGVNLMHPLPTRYLHDFTAQFMFGYIVDGRNAGQSTIFTTGLYYTVHFPGSPRP